MSINEHILFRASFSYIEHWLPAEKRTQVAMKRLLDDELLAPVNRYDVGSFLYCITLESVFNRLEKIIQITRRALYSKKGENRAILKKEWMVYSYHNYMTIYQSVLDITAQLTNEVLDLGIPSKDCKPYVVLHNRRVKFAGIKPDLYKLIQITKKHRDGKNLLLHYGYETDPPVRMGLATSFNVSEMAKKLGWEEDKALVALEEFLAIKDQEALVKLMDNECKNLEMQVRQLLDKLFSQYERIRAFYSPAS